MAKVLFTPFSVAFSLIAGLVARKIFDRVWHAIDDEDPPDPGEELEPLPRILLAAALQSAVFALARVLFDRQARKTFRGLTGTWPGPKDKS
jgi:Protein of unknown function (DUF4235)